MVGQAYSLWILCIALLISLSVGFYWQSPGAQSISAKEFGMFLLHLNWWLMGMGNLRALSKREIMIHGFWWSCQDICGSGCYYPGFHTTTGRLAKKWTQNGRTCNFLAKQSQQLPMEWEDLCFQVCPYLLQFNVSPAQISTSSRTSAKKTKHFLKNVLNYCVVLLKNYLRKYSKYYVLVLGMVLKEWGG